MSNESSRTGIFGFIAGAAIGAALGILFAPGSGKETRERITRRVRDGKDEVDDLIDQARSEWNKAKGKATDATTMTKEEVSDFVRFVFEESKDLKERLKRDVHSSAEDISERARKAAEKVGHSAN